MNPIIHTIIATTIIYFSYRVGLYIGTKKGELSILLMFMKILNANDINISEEEGIHVTDKEGKQRKIS